MATKKSNFVTKVLSTLNKSEAQKQEESVVAFQKRAFIECKGQVGIRSNKVETLSLELELAESKLTQAKEDFEAYRFTTASDFSNYLYNRNYAQNNVISAQNNVNIATSNLNNAKNELALFEEILVDLKD